MTTTHRSIDETPAPSGARGSTARFAGPSGACGPVRRRRAGTALCLAAALAVAAVPAAAETGPMSDKEIRGSVIGKRIYLQTPLGGEFPLNYRKNGKVDGDGKALGLGRFMAPADSGRWWIEGGRLCQQWTEWYDGKAHCFLLRKTGESTLYWKRDDGLEGEARIGR